MSKKKLDVQEAVYIVCEAADSLCAFIIDRYFNGNVSKFFESSSKYEAFFDLSRLEKNATWNIVYPDMQHYNWVGIKKKYIRALVGHNYDNAEFMAEFRSILAQLGYVVKPHGTFWYKGKRHPYYAKYFPPKSKLEAIFSNRKYAKEIANPKNHDTRVRKVLEAIRNDYVPEKTKKKYQKKPSKSDTANASDIFQTPYELLEAFKSLLDTEIVGPPTHDMFKAALEPILTHYLFKEAESHWNKKPAAVRERFGDGWMAELTDEEQIEIHLKRFGLLSKVYKQLTGPDASRMFKDEWIGKDKDGNNIFKPADENRIEKARKAVYDKIRKIYESKKRLCHLTNSSTGKEQ